MAYTRKSFPMHKGTTSHKSALKQRKAHVKKMDMKGNVISEKDVTLKPTTKEEFFKGGKKGASVSDFDETKAYQKRHEQLLNQGFTPEDADRMIKDRAVTGTPSHEFTHDKAKPKTEKSPAKGSGKYDRKIRKAAKKFVKGKTSQGHRKLRKAKAHSGFSDVAVKEDLRPELEKQLAKKISKVISKEYKKSPLKQKVDPDAPGTPGKPGYEPPVRYDELDEKGKKLWHKVRGTEYTPPKKSRPEPTWPGTDEHRKPEDIPSKEYKEKGIKKYPIEKPKKK